MLWVPIILTMQKAPFAKQLLFGYLKQRWESAHTYKKPLSSSRFKFFTFYALDMKRKLGGDQIGNDSVLLNYKLQFVTGALVRHQQSVYTLLTCITIWNYVHFSIDAYFNHSVIFVLRFDLFCVGFLCCLVPKWLINTFSCPQEWSWWFFTMVEERSMKRHAAL